MEEHSIGILKEGGLLTPDGERQFAQEGTSSVGTSVAAELERQMLGSQKQSDVIGLLSPAASRSRSPAKNYVCPECGKTFTRPCRLDEHERTHSGARPFVCAYPGCGKAYMRDTHLIVHSRMHLEADQRPYSCTYPGCNKAFVTNQRLRRHASVHSDSKPHVCSHDGCVRAFAKRSQLHVHECSHTGENPYGCDHHGCDKSFKYPSQLKKHKATHSPSDDNDARYRCAAPGCTETFAKWSQLQTHRTDTHKPEPYTCDICNAQFKQRYALAAHLLRHDPDRPMFLCSYDNCSRFYLDERALRMHERMVHSPEARRFLCPHSECDKSYAYPHSLRKHIRAVHQNSPNACERKPTSAKRYSTKDAAKNAGSTRRSPTILEIASGMAYSNPEISGRLLPCSVDGCRFRFRRQEELSVHLGAVHDISLSPSK
ncbi:hypothetical protein IW140_003065 [Coemansia sp. RSA 1813]|nr:hypothetical protein EV178_004222 [Coemansia sp. RSA 1646]KAJ1771294.1 hypothetical protein LPJ74_002445 [Coemansia sp. RSA 1843]KAJ2088948.1 hypothetical protein IW138_003789 [Coemansia sp. RSA 986]KAJ2569511.1 hypothetical protein IW140_003065 [Coemansia sp. RSA 1813]